MRRSGESTQEEKGKMRPQLPDLDEARRGVYIRRARDDRTQVFYAQCELKRKGERTNE